MDVNKKGADRERGREKKKREYINEQNEEKP